MIIYRELCNFIGLLSSLAGGSPRIVCTSKIGNLSEHVGVPPEVGSGYGHFEVLGVGVWFREAETESKIVAPNRKASIGYLSYMVS